VDIKDGKLAVTPSNDVMSSLPTAYLSSQELTPS